MTTSTTERREAFFQKTTLDNGLRIVTSEMPYTRAVSICVYIGVGSRYETDEQAGVSHYIEHMVFKGTERRPEPQMISGEIEGTGGVINAGTEHELTVIWCKVALPHFESSLDLMLDVVRNSVFEPDAIENERMVVIEELNMINDYPNYKVDALIDEMLWPDHPLGRDIAGSRETVSAITQDMLLEHVRSYYTPTNTVISVAGNINHDHVVSLIEGMCEGWRSTEKKAWAPFEGDQSAAKSRLEYRRTEQTHLSIAVPGVSLVDPDRYVLDLISTMLGEGMSSRLFIEVREKRGLAYDVHSGVAHFMDTGAFVVSAGVDPKRVYDAIQTILDQVGSFRQGVPEEELEKAKNLSTGRMLLRLEDSRAVASWMGNQELLLGKIAHPDDVVSRVREVTTKDIERMANAVLLTDRLNMAVVGPCRGHRRLERMLQL